MRSQRGNNTAHLNVKRDSCSSSAFEKLYKLMEDIQGNSIRRIFTSHECKTFPENKYYILTLGCLSSVESRCFLNKELQKSNILLPSEETDNLIKNLVDIGHGLPYALKLMCSEVVRMDNDNYIFNLKVISDDELDDGFLLH